jgi:hypothetical protein
VAAILQRIAADVDELARRRVADLDAAAALPQRRTQRRRRVAEPDLDFREFCRRSKLSQSERSWDLFAAERYRRAAKPTSRHMRRATRSGTASRDRAHDPCPRRGVQQTDRPNVVPGTVVTDTPRQSVRLEAGEPDRGWPDFCGRHHDLPAGGHDAGVWRALAVGRDAADNRGMRELPAGTVTMLFSDIEGSTALLGRLGDRYGEALAAQRAIMRAAISASGGHEMGTEGDSFFVVFESAAAAVACCLAAQRALAGHPWPGGVVVRVRMGLHSGDPARYQDGMWGWMCTGRRGSRRPRMAARLCCRMRPGCWWPPGCPPGCRCGTWARIG